MKFLITKYVLKETTQNGDVFVLYKRDNSLFCEKIYKVPKKGLQDICKIRENAEYNIVTTKEGCDLTVTTLHTCEPIQFVKAKKIEIKNNLMWLYYTVEPGCIPFRLIFILDGMDVYISEA